MRTPVIFGKENDTEHGNQSSCDHFGAEQVLGGDPPAPRAEALLLAVPHLAEGLRGPGRAEQAAGRSGAVRENGAGSDPTARCAESKAYYAQRMGMVERAAKYADKELCFYILKGVTEGCSYGELKAKYDIPCSKGTYYDRYRRFFWLLNQIRG